MIRKSTTRAAIARALVTYAVACFVILQVLDIVLEPLGVPVASIRWIMLLMISIAPALVLLVAWRSRRRPAFAASSPGDGQSDVLFQIGNATLDTARREILFAGSPADVQPKVFDLIEFLVRARDRVVSKDELLNEIWPDVIVTDSSLTQSIKRARDIFSQNGFEENVIRTVPRKGYMFDHAVELNVASADPGSTDWMDIALPTAIVTVIAAALGALLWNSNGEPVRKFTDSNAANSLVVLPFANLTPDKDFNYFSDGLTETLTNSLTTVRNLRVIAGRSAFSFRDSEANYGEIGSELNVAHIVEGSVQRSNNELRITARLIRSRDGEQIWSQIFSREFEDVFALQDDLARSIVELMSGLLAETLVPPQSLATNANGANVAEAYRLLLLGLEKGRSISGERMQEAEQHFRAALRLRPDYPEATIALANVLRVRATLGELPRERTFVEALALIRDVLATRPDFAEAYLQLAEIQHRHFWDFADARESFEKALELNPGSASVHAAYSRFLSKVGEFGASVRESEIALDLDPKSVRAATSVVLRRIRADSLDSARGLLDSLHKTQPDHADLPWLETNWHLRNGSYRDALKWVALEEFDYLRLSLSAITLYHLQRKDQAQEALDELIATDADGAAFQIAEVYAQWNDPDTAFHWLERAFSQGDPGMAELYSSVNLETLYADSRFSELVKRVGLPAGVQDP